MEAKISRTCLGRTSSMSKLLWESSKKMKIDFEAGLGIQLHTFTNKEKTFIHAKGLQRKISNNELWMIGGLLFF